MVIEDMAKDVFRGLTPFADNSISVHLGLITKEGAPAHGIMLLGDSHVGDDQEIVQGVNHITIDDSKDDNGILLLTDLINFLTKNDN